MKNYVKRKISVMSLEKSKFYQRLNYRRKCNNSFQFEYLICKQKKDTIYSQFIILQYFNFIVMSFIDEHMQPMEIEDQQNEVRP